MFMQDERKLKQRYFSLFSLSPLRISAIYAFFSALWFLFSAWILFRTVDDAATIQSLMNINALVFIIFTAWLVFFLTNSYAEAIRTSQRALEDSERLYHSTIDALRDGIVVVTRDLQVRMYNTVFSEWVGRESYRAVEGASLPDLLSSWPAAAWDGIDAVFAGNGMTEGEFTIETSSGTTIPTEIRRIPVIDNGVVTMAVVVIRDITSRTMLENLKKGMFKEMEKNTLEFAVLSDQIRNPLQVILGLVSHGETETDTIVRSQIREIDALVQQLDRGWVESGKLREFITLYYREAETTAPE
jgi:PAS domain S-box-containing protein